MSRWKQLEARPEVVKELYCSEDEEVAEKVPLAIRQAIGDELYTYDFTTREDPAARKALITTISRLVGSTEKATWARWIQLPLQADNKKHSQASLVNLLFELKEKELDLLNPNPSPVPAPPVTITVVPQIKVKDTVKFLLNLGDTSKRKSDLMKKFESERSHRVERMEAGRSSVDPSAMLDIFGKYSKK